MGKFIFRGKDSGVFYGEQVSVNGQHAVIKNSRKIYHWDGANCLEQLSVEGTKKPENCRFTIENDNEIYDLVQKLPVSELAQKNLDEVKIWKI